MSGERLRRGDAGLLDDVGQQRQGQVDAVLHQHLGHVQVDAGLKVTVRLYEPSLVHCDDMYSMSSTPLTCCSIGAATVSATTWALAPG